MKYLLILLLIIAFAYSNAQTNGTTKLHLYSPVFPTFCADTVLSVRKYKTQNVFTDYKIFCLAANKTNCAITFKVKNKSWYIKSNNHWKLFYDDSAKCLKSIVLKKQQLQPQADNPIIIGDDSLYAFISINAEYENSSFTNVYYFHPDYGIVIIRGHDSVIKRLDYFNPALKREFF